MYVDQSVPIIIGGSITSVQQYNNYWLLCCVCMYQVPIILGGWDTSVYYTYHWLLYFANQIPIILRGEGTSVQQVLVAVKGPVEMPVFFSMLYVMGGPSTRETSSSNASRPTFVEIIFLLCINCCIGEGGQIRERNKKTSNMATTMPPPRCLSSRTPFHFYSLSIRCRT